MHGYIPQATSMRQPHEFMQQVPYHVEQPKLTKTESATQGKGSRRKNKEVNKQVTFEESKKPQ